MHIPFQKLTDYAADRLTDPHERQTIAAHINHCDECRQALTIALTLGHHRSNTATEEPPVSLVQRVLRAVQQQTQATVLQHLVATLLYDSKLAAVAPGVRGALHDRELLYAFGRFDLHLSIVQGAEGNSYTLLGQLMKGEGYEGDIEGSRIDLYQDATRVRTVLTDTQGRFRLSRLPSGLYALTIATEHITTTIEAVPLCTVAVDSENESVLYR